MDNADTVRKLRTVDFLYGQMAIGDTLRGVMRDGADAIEAMQTELAEEQRVRRNAVNELCHKCGRYREEHNGACDGCRWHHAKA